MSTETVFPIRLNQKNEDSSWYWVAHPAGGCDTPETTKLIENRYKLWIYGGVEDKEASYSYDDWALVKLGRDWYLLSTSGCSCPSPSETWRIEIGPATLLKIRAHVTGGYYDGYTVPKKQMDDFIALLDAAPKLKKRPSRTVRMRNIAVVLDRILDKIPDDFEYKRDLALDFSEIKSSARYCAPELMPEQWGCAADALTSWLGKPEPEGWRTEVAELFAGRDESPSRSVLKEEK